MLTKERSWVLWYHCSGIHLGQDCSHRYKCMCMIPQCSHSNYYDHSYIDQSHIHPTLWCHVSMGVIHSWWYIHNTKIGINSYSYGLLLFATILMKTIVKGLIVKLQTETNTTYHCMCSYLSQGSIQDYRHTRMNHLCLSTLGHSCVYCWYIH